MARQTDPEKTYEAGYRDGYQCAITEMQQKIDELVDQFRRENRANLDALRDEVARLRAFDAAVETVRESKPSLN